MDKRYFFVVISYSVSNSAWGKMNMGFVATEDNPFSLNNVREAAYNNLNAEIKKENMVVENFIEFSTRYDFLTFFKNN
jgi:hypothetical protein